MIPATAPLKLKRFQKRLSMIAGPKAAPKIPHALETSAMIEPALGFDAMMSAATDSKNDNTAGPHHLFVTCLTFSDDRLVHITRESR